MASRTCCAVLWLTAACTLLPAGSAQNTFKATLAPLPNTTGIALGGSGSAIVELVASGLNKLTVSVESLVRCQKACINDAMLKGS
jgi:hypothetical protein